MASVSIRHIFGLMASSFAWEDATVHVSELGWSTVGGVFEGIKAYWSEAAGELFVFRLREHLERLQRSMRLVRLPVHYSVQELTDAITGILRDNEAREDTYIFPMGYLKDSYTDRWNMLEQQSSLLIHTRPTPSHLFSGKALSAGVSQWRRISRRRDAAAGQEPVELSQRPTRPDGCAAGGYDTSLILNQQGKVAEGPGACVVIVRDNKVITPDLTQSVLESITRDAIITLAREDLGWWSRNARSTAPSCTWRTKCSCAAPMPRSRPLLRSIASKSAMARSGRSHSNSRRRWTMRSAATMAGTPSGALRSAVPAPLLFRRDRRQVDTRSIVAPRVRFVHSTRAHERRSARIGWHSLREFDLVGDIRPYASAHARLDGFRTRSNRRPRRSTI